VGSGTFKWNLWTPPEVSIMSGKLSPLRSIRSASPFLKGTLRLFSILAKIGSMQFLPEQFVWGIPTPV